MSRAEVLAALAGAAAVVAGAGVALVVASRPTDRCRAGTGPIPKLDGATFRCVRAPGHPMPHTAADGTWWEYGTWWA